MLISWQAKKSKTPPPFSPPAATSTSPPSDLATWRTENKIVVNTSDTNKGVPTAPYFSFADAPIRQEIKDLFTSKKFVKPSPIQAQCWPVLMSGSDIVGIAETGSGKTLAFSVPALEKLKKDTPKNNRKPRMLVLAPTRELAQQSAVVLEEFGEPIGLRSMVVFGGVPKFEQKKALTRGVEIIVATPGRLKDLCQEGACDLSQVSMLVLDEADRMLDMGFEMDVREIIGQTLPVGTRQTAMFSATWPAVIQKLASEFMEDPLKIYVGFNAIKGSNGEDQVDDSLSANKRVTQTVEVIEDRARDDR